MIDFKSLRKTCAECEEKDYWKCRKCRVYEALNRACDFCGGLETFPLTVSTGKGLKKIFVCRKCHNILV
jgi:hypothetical protein